MSKKAPQNPLISFTKDANLFKKLNPDRIVRYIRKKTLRLGFQISEEKVAWQYILLL